MDKKLSAVLMIVIFALIISAVLASNYDSAVKRIYTQQAHNVTLDDGSVVLTPEPMIDPELQTQIWGLGAIGVWIGAGLAIFLTLFKVGKGGVSSRN